MCWWHRRFIAALHCITLMNTGLSEAGCTVASRLSEPFSSGVQELSNRILQGRPLTKLQDEND